MFKRVASEKGSTDKAVKKYAAVYGGKAIKLTGATGITDWLLLLPPGRVFFIESKKRVGGVVAEVQEAMIAELSAMGFNATVICSGEDLNQYIKECG